MTRHALIPFAAACLLVTAPLAAVAQHAPPAAARPGDLPEDRMARRFPQPVRVAFLIGLPVLDESSGTVGRVRQVVRTAEGRIRLIVAYGGVLGFGTRPVALPVERVAMLGAHVAALDIPRAEMDRTPDWRSTGEAPLGGEEVIRVALTRR